MGNIKTGICINYSDIERDIPHAIAMGVETISLVGKAPLANIDIDKTAYRVSELLADTAITVSTLGVYGNPIEKSEDRDALEKLIMNAYKFGTDTVGTFAGAITGKPVEDAIPAFKTIFSDLLVKAQHSGIRICLENCLQKGSWKCATNNIAFNPKAWEIIFNELPYDNLGLEWEPAHQIAQLINPLEQLKEWTDKIFHIHGKDAVINYDFIYKYGVTGTGYIASFCNPGRGVTDWTEIAKILKSNGYKGSVSLEPGQSPSQSDAEFTVEKEKAVIYLQKCINNA